VPWTRWRQTLFDEERSFCSQMGITPEELHRLSSRARPFGRLVPNLREITEKQSSILRRATVRPDQCVGGVGVLGATTTCCTALSRPVRPRTGCEFSHLRVLSRNNCCCNHLHATPHTARFHQRRRGRGTGAATAPRPLAATCDGPVPARAVDKRAPQLTSSRASRSSRAPPPRAR
jgi:hypothetical protein